MHAFDPCGGHFARKQRIFREILKVSAAKRIALDVVARAEQNRYTFGIAFFTQRNTHAFDQFRIPRTGRSGSGREANCGDALQHIRAAFFFGFLFAQTVRAVGHVDGLNSEFAQCLKMPEILAGTKRGFFFGSHCGNNVLIFHLLLPF